VFFKAIEQEFGGSRLGVSLGLTITTTVGALAAPFIGHALDRFPLKRVMAAGSISMALGFLALSQVRTQLEFYLALGAFIGFGASAMGGLATAKLVTNWFSRRRGTALGIAATGISASGVVMPFVSATLIESYGWREGFMLYGAFTAFVVVPLVLRLVVSTPEDVGLRPDGKRPDPPPEQRPVTTPPAPRALPQPVYKDRNFWVLVSVIGLLFCCQSATLTHMVPRITDAGVSLQNASLVMSLCAGLGIAGKLSFGWLMDRWTARSAIWFTVTCQVLGQLAMLQQTTWRCLLWAPPCSAMAWAAWCPCRVPWWPRSSAVRDSDRRWACCVRACSRCRSSAFPWREECTTSPAATRWPSSCSSCCI
jgi:predicted MFS family arabinose efflux permease